MKTIFSYGLDCHVSILNFLKTPACFQPKKWHQTQGLSACVIFYLKYIITYKKQMQAFSYKNLHLFYSF